MAFTRGCKKMIILALAVMAFSALGDSDAIGADDLETKLQSVAIQGYDPVAYFTEGRAIRGKSDYFFTWNDARWLFATAEHRDRFAADPERYAPKFRGYCAYGMSMGKQVAADPQEWTIVDGKLYLNYNRKTRDIWREDQAALIKKAEKNWAERTD
ncbi:MAG TPA: YHS domain-containing (seleno)protein [Desulfobacterales bacterium]